MSHREMEGTEGY